MLDTNPNSYQVGGDWYQGNYQHWDFVLNTGVGYLEGCATKYISRWRKAGKGEADLLKARHYTSKLLTEFRTAYPRLRMPQTFLRKELVAFIAVNQIQEEDIPALVALVTWESKSDLQVAYDCIQATLKHHFHDPELKLADPQLVPLEDSNKHAERA